MNKEIQERDDSVQILETEEDHRGYALKATFDGETFRKIQGLKLNLKVEDNLLSRMQRLFARDKISYHEYQSQVTKLNMVLDKNLIKPFWYIEQETLVTILQVIKNLDEDLKRKIVSIVTLRNKKEEERQELIYNSYSFHNEINMMDTSDYYFSE